MKHNIETLDGRVAVIAEINSETTKTRKQESLKQFEIQSGRIKQYVKENLEGQYYQDTVKEMPIMSSINIQRRVVSKKAIIYNESPDRSFSELNDEAKKIIDSVYKDMRANIKLAQANKGYVYQDQSVGMIVPKDGRLVMRTFKMHQIDVVPSLNDPETADAYLISVFDRENYVETNRDETATGKTGKSEQSQATITDETDELANLYQYKKYTEKYIYWDVNYNFMMNGLGEFIDSDTGEIIEGNLQDFPSPVRGVIPFFDVAKERDFEFFARPTNSLTDFTVSFNSLISDLLTTIKMNGYAVGVLKAPAEMQPTSEIIGAAMMLKLDTSGLRDNEEVGFSFVSPNSSIGEINDSIDRILNYYITTEGIGGDSINSTGKSQSFTSGVDRFLAMVSEVSANKDDYEAFQDVEAQVWNIVKAWLSVSMGTDLLDKKYQVNVPSSSEVDVTFYKPELIQSKTEKINNAEKMIELELATRAELYADINDVSIETAFDAIHAIDKENALKV